MQLNFHFLDHKGQSSAENAIKSIVTPEKIPKDWKDNMWFFQKNIKTNKTKRKETRREREKH